MNAQEPDKHTLYVLTGPTAVGKTRLAIDWAKQNNARILSCDSLLFYRGMDIGTAKPSLAEQAEVPHMGLNLAEVRDQYSVYKYIDFAKEAISQIHASGQKVLIAGGSGFYLKCFYGPVVDTVQVPDSVRSEVAKIEEALGLPGLVEALLKLNPEGVGDLHLENPRRVVRALERCMATGKTVLELRREFEAQPGSFDDYKKHTCFLSRSDGSLHARIRERIDQMLKDGLVDEVRNLERMGIRDNPSAVQSIGYRETLAWLQEEEGNLEALAETIAQNTRTLVKKQKTWFKKQIPIDQVLDLDLLSPEEALANLFAQ